MTSRDAVLRALTTSTPAGLVMDFDGVLSPLVDDPASSTLLPDTPVVIGGVIYIAAAISISNLIVDLIYTFVDPRLKTRLRNY